MQAKVGAGWHGVPPLQGESPGLSGMVRTDRGCGSPQGPRRRSGFSFADSAFWAAVTICSLERGLQKNVPCLEMENFPSDGGDGGWLLRGMPVLQLSLPRACGPVCHDDPH